MISSVNFPDPPPTIQQRELVWELELQCQQQLFFFVVVVFIFFVFIEF